ncbi:MAG: coproporphyrinogen III oxidase family protein [Coriobacteriia bacterium]|nr:coproporphyrinogen III oxidase family protein [Coriobacteriia bacterium]
MLSERMLSAVMRRTNDKYLTLSPSGIDQLPVPVPGREYLLYVHIPFCERLCPYCSFNRFPFNQERADAYFENLRTEMRMVAALGYDFASMYIGGGTPTIDLPQLIKTIDLAKELFSIKEVSSETNPNHLYPKWIEPLQGRVDRFSVGVQSLDDALLKQMDRYDKYGSAADILERLKSVEGAFHSINADMIFNFPSQSWETLKRDVELVKSTGVNQVTFYPLMASPAVAESLKRTVGKVDYIREHKYYMTISEMMADGFTPGSAWTFSRTGGGMIDEYIVDYEDYVGIGSGAFSFLEGALYVNTFSLKLYGERIGEGKTAAVQSRAFNKKERMQYRFLMALFGMRLDKRAFKADFDVSIELGLALEMAFFRSAGAFTVDNADELVLSSTGRYLLVAMMREFFIGVNNLRDQARSAISTPERELLFGDGKACEDAHAAGAAAAEAIAETEAAEDSPVPL